MTLMGFCPCLSPTPLSFNLANSSEDLLGFLILLPIADVKYPCSTNKYSVYICKIFA